MKNIKVKNELEENAYKIKVKIKGVAPLLMNRPCLEENKRKKQVYIPEEEVEKAIYQNSKGVFAPATWIKSSLTKAATRFKLKGSGKKTYKDLIKGEIIIEPIEISLKEKWVIDERYVNVNRAKILRWRPRWNNWSMEFDIIIADKNDLCPDDLQRFLTDSGKYIGIGDNRPENGRFIIEKFEPIY